VDQQLVQRIPDFPEVHWRHLEERSRPDWSRPGRRRALGRSRALLLTIS
jgi:hypothetical protein